MKAYPNELRNRVLEAYQNQDGSMQKLAKRFKVSFHFVFQLIKRFRETGQVAGLNLTVLRLKPLVQCECGRGCGQVRVRLTT